MELKPITVSFKKTPEEILLYGIIEKYTSKGAFIKDTLINVLIRNEMPKKNFIGVNIIELFGLEDE